MGPCLAWESKEDRIPLYLQQLPQTPHGSFITQWKVKRKKDMGKRKQVCMILGAGTLVPRWMKDESAWPWHLAPPFSPAPESSSIEARQWCPGEEEVTSYLPFIAMSDRRSEMSTLATKESCKQNDTGKEVQDDSICLAKKGTQELFLSHLCRWKLGDKLLRYLQMVRANSTMCVGREEPSTGKAGPAHVWVFSSCSSTSQQH